MLTTQNAGGVDHWSGENELKVVEGSETLAAKPIAQQKLLICREFVMSFNKMVSMGKSN